MPHRGYSPDAEPCARLCSFTGGGLNDDKQEEQEKKKGSRWERLIYWLKGHLKLPAMLQFGKNRDLRKLLDKESKF